MEQQTVSKETWKLSLKAALSQEIHSYINNGELQTRDRQLLTTSTSLENLVNSNFSNLQHCDCEKETEFDFCSVKENTVEEFDFDSPKVCNT